MENVVVTIMFFGSTAFALWKFFDTRHKERMAIIERSLISEDVRYLYGRVDRNPNRLTALKWGLAVALVGVALLVAIPLMYWVEDNFRPLVVIGLMCLGGGIGFLSYYVIALRADKQQAV